VRWVLLRQNEMLERNGGDSGGAYPPVRHRSHVVLGGQGFEDGDGEDDGLGVVRLRVFLVQEEILRVVDVVVLWILHPDPKRLRLSVHLFNFKFKLNKLYYPNKIAFLNGKFYFAAQWWD
jgi:hypothetical protein